MNVIVPAKVEKKKNLARYWSSDSKMVKGFPFRQTGILDAEYPGEVLTEAQTV
jgi:hypothetical protein